MQIKTKYQDEIIYIRLIGELGAQSAEISERLNEIADKYTGAKKAVLDLSKTSFMDDEAGCTFLIGTYNRFRRYTVPVYIANPSSAIDETLSRNAIYTLMSKTYEKIEMEKPAETVLKEEEIVAGKLRSLYQKYGYLPYKMSKFEEYDLYARNKEFLDGARIVTFNDVDGKLLALKPDVTLSIVKNDSDGEAKRKVYYNETVYRAQKKSGGFKELLQTGLECIGEIDLYDEYETLYLAAASLNEISESFILDISHRGLLSAVIKEVNADKQFSKQIMRLIAEKNTHGIIAFCETNSVKPDKFLALVNAYGTPKTALEKLEKICESEETKRALVYLKTLCAFLENTEFKGKFRVDFSVVGSGNYYDGVVFSGFIDGIGEAVLSGGRYDRLLARMGKKSGAIGFAVYLDLLENLGKKRKREDVDIVVLYDEQTALLELIKTVQTLVDEGNTVSAQRQKGALRCKNVVDLTGGAIC